MTGRQQSTVPSVPYTLSRDKWNKHSGKGSRSTNMALVPMLTKSSRNAPTSPRAFPTLPAQGPVQSREISPWVSIWLPIPHRCFCNSNLSYKRNGLSSRCSEGCIFNLFIWLLFSPFPVIDWWASLPQDRLLESTLPEWTWIWHQAGPLRCYSAFHNLDSM